MSSALRAILSTSDIVEIPPIAVDEASSFDPQLSHLGEMCLDRSEPGHNPTYSIGLDPPGARVLGVLGRNM